MRILLVHPEDRPDRGPWSAESWDRIVDLGMAGPIAYGEWHEQFRCPVERLGPIDAKELISVRNVLQAGAGRLQDSEDLDWWELLAILLHERLEKLLVLRKLATTIDDRDEVLATRAGSYPDALNLMRPQPVKAFPRKRAAMTGTALHYLQVARRFSSAQLAEIFWDKFDASQRIRSAFSRKPKPGPTPVVLLPSAYGNVSRIGVAYARALPDAEFLQVVTRRSGLVSGTPKNVRVARLASYASSAGSEEARELVRRWQGLRRELRAIPEIALLDHLGFLNSFPRQLRDGLSVRDAWRRVFELENIQAVLCGDDTNPHTHIPLLLARKRNIPALAVHHGALDGRHLFKRSHADVILAKGRMERNYLVNVCGVDEAEVEIAAPGPIPSKSRRSRAEGGAASQIVFFSEPYELTDGRAEEFYRELLPPLADLAVQARRRLVVKLHPFESVRQRRQIVLRLLSEEQRRVTEIVSGALSEDLLGKTWFGITVLSSVTTECALRGIPCFLCGWLEFWPYGYLKQFQRFGAGYVIESQSQIADIPKILENYTIRPETVRDLWQPAAPDRLAELFETCRRQSLAVAM